MTTARSAFAFAIASLACVVALSARAATPAAAESALREQLQQARWPADIVGVAERYVASYPQGPAASGARADLDVARKTKRLLERSDIRLYRSDFAVGGAPALHADLRKAALADKDAAERIAHVYRDGEGGVEANPSRYIGWLQYSAALGNGPASYELALHYRKSDQPALAAPYEARAEELGFKAPPSLDHVRK